MNEAALVTKLRGALLRRLPGALIYKHNERMTAGIPDLSVHLNHATTWVEVKLVQADETVKLFQKHLELLQLEQLCRLELRAEAWYAIAFPMEKQLGLGLIRPTQLRRNRRYEFVRRFVPAVHLVGAAALGPFDQVVARLAELVKGAR